MLYSTAPRIPPTHLVIKRWQLLFVSANPPTVPLWGSILGPFWIHFEQFWCQFWCPWGRLVPILAPVGLFGALWRVLGVLRTPLGPQRDQFGDLFGANVWFVSGPWTKMPGMVPNGAGKVFFWPIQTLLTFGQHGFQLRICRICMYEPRHTWHLLLP